MNDVTLSLRYRPLRVGLLVRQGELADLERAAGIASLLWGGIHNPLIPIGPDTACFAEQLITLFQIDVLYPVGQSPEITAFTTAHQFLRTPRMSGSDLFVADWPSSRMRVTCLDSMNIIDRHWEKDFKARPQGYTSQCRLVSWDLADTERELLALSYGYFPTDINLSDDFQTAFVLGMRAGKTTIDPGTPLPEELSSTYTPLLLTAVDLEASGGGHRDWSGIYVGDAKNYDDLLTFWNIRAAGNALTFLPTNAQDRFALTTRAHVAWLDALPNRHPNIENNISIVSSTATPQAIDDVVSAFPTQKRKLICQCDEVVWNGLNILPAEFHFGREQVLGFVDKRQGSYLATVTLPAKQFLVDPIDARRRVDDQYLAASLHPLGELAYAGYTLKPPFKTDLNVAYSRAIGIDPWSIRSERDGIGVLITRDEAHVRLHPMAQEAAIEALLGRTGLKLEISQAGRIATRLLEKLGDIENVRVFKIRGVRNLVDGLSSTDAIGRGGATKTIWNEGQFKQHEDLYIEQRNTPKLATSDVFDYMLRGDFFRAGLELHCEHCGLANWLSLRQIDDVWVCEYCGHRNQTSLQVRNRGDWRFRKSGLLARDNRQEGAIPVLLGLLVLKRIFDHGDFLYAMSHNIKGPTWKCEADFIAAHSDRREGIEWIFGEAKSEGGCIDVNDIENASRLVNAVREQGMTGHAAFIKTANSFQESELNLFRQLSDAGIPPVLFTNRELEPYQPYWEAGTPDKVPHQHPMSFSDLARNADHRYLARFAITPPPPSVP
jgi:hypothetical protein